MKAVRIRRNYQRGVTLIEREARACVLDGDKLLAFWLTDFKAEPTAAALSPGLEPGKIVALAAADDDLLVAATADSLTAFTPEGQQLWSQPLACMTLAAREDAVFVGDRTGRLLWLNAQTGAQVASAEDVHAAGLAARGRWVYASDPRGHRLVRFSAR